MAAALKTLGQVVPVTANTDIDLYTAPAGTTEGVVCSSIAITNQSSSAITYQVRIRVAGATATAKQLICCDASLPAKSADFLTLGIGLQATDVVTVQASSTSVSFNLFGRET